MWTGIVLAATAALAIGAAILVLRLRARRAILAEPWAEPPPLPGWLRRRYTPARAKIAFPDWPHPETIDELAGSVRAGDELWYFDSPSDSRRG